MTTARELMDTSRAALAKNAATASAIGAVYKFVLSGDGGGTWFVSLRAAPSILESNDSAAGGLSAECTITMAASDYVDMLEGRARGQDLFFAGKMQIDGDLGLAMKLQTLSEILV